ncbi:MAG: DedA family protein [Bacillota bacterium]
MALPTPSTDIGYILAYGYSALFLLVAASEVTSFLPIGIILIGVGALARAHYLSFFISFFTAAAASTMSDIIVFEISRRLGKKAGYRRFVERNRFANRIEGYAKRHPRATVFLSRLIGVASTPVNAIAGLSQMRVVEFAFFDLLGNALCTAAYLAAGYFIGAAWKQDAKLTSLGIGVALAIGVGGYVLSAYLRARKKKQRSSPATET